jgi:hypothetical protein
VCGFVDGAAAVGWRKSAREVAEQQIDEGFGGDLQEVGHLFAYAYADEADGEIELLGDGYGDV